MAKRYRAHVFGRSRKRFRVTPGDESMAVAVDCRFRGERQAFARLEIGAIPNPQQPLVSVCPIWENPVRRDLEPGETITEATPAVATARRSSISGQPCRRPTTKR